MSRAGHRAQVAQPLLAVRFSLRQQSDVCGDVTRCEPAAPAKGGPAGKPVLPRGQRGGIIRRVLVALFVLVTLASLYLLRGPILRCAAQLLIVEDDLEPADAIVVLGDDNYAGDRAARAAELFHARWAPVVVASGRYLRPYASLADLIARDISERTVPTAAIITLRHRAASTREEAAAIGQLASERRWRRLIVVTSSYHTRRSRYIFRNVLEAEIEIRVAPAADSQFDAAAWWQSREGRKTFAREAAAWLLAIWESFTAAEAPVATTSHILVFTARLTACTVL